MQSLKELDLSGLVEIDGGRVALAVQSAIRRCTADCYDRPGVKKSRKVTLEIEIVPVQDENGLCENCKALAKIKESTPVRESRVFDCSVGSGNRLLFRPDSLDDAGQGAFDFDAEAGE